MNSAGWIHVRHFGGQCPCVSKQYPDSDAGRAAAFLEGKGYNLEGEDIVYQRFVRLVDDARRNELLIIYYENLNGTGLTAADLSEKGRAAGQREKVFKELMNRALKSFTVLKEKPPKTRNRTKSTSFLLFLL